MSKASPVVRVSFLLVFIMTVDPTRTQMRKQRLENLFPFHNS